MLADAMGHQQAHGWGVPGWVLSTVRMDEVSYEAWLRVHFTTQGVSQLNTSPLCLQTQRQSITAKGYQSHHSRVCHWPWTFYNAPTFLLQLLPE